MSTSRIGIVISTTREGRFGDKAAAWIRDIAAQRGDMDVELLDLRDYPLPFFSALTRDALMDLIAAFLKKSEKPG